MDGGTKKRKVGTSKAVELAENEDQGIGEDAGDDEDDEDELYEEPTKKKPRKTRKAKVV